jgi:hypothetical protein
MTDDRFCCDPDVLHKANTELLKTIRNFEDILEKVDKVVRVALAYDWFSAESQIYAFEYGILRVLYPKIVESFDEIRKKIPDFADKVYDLEWQKMSRVKSLADAAERSSTSELAASINKRTSAGYEIADKNGSIEIDELMRLNKLINENDVMYEVLEPERIMGRDDIIGRDDIMGRDDAKKDNAGLDSENILGPVNILSGYNDFQLN